MAALGRLAARVRNAGQLNILAAAKAWERTNPNVAYPASCRHKLSAEHDFRAAGYSTKPRGILGFLGKDGLFSSREPSRPAPGNDYGVDTMERDYDSEDELARKKPSKNQLMSVMPDDAKPEQGQVHKVTETALDKGANVATSAMDNVGSILTKTGLEVELDVSLQELSIEKLVLKDLGLVLVIKTKPQPPPGSPPPPEERDTRERKARPGVAAAGAQPQPTQSES
ncbi:hypothetical protein KC19_8G030100 [Ceratodon purpureus]|uniref:Uncharacterized protein n=1 Tax=Ceratodon purpureus TaxID=3225 RepID=A0A8T0GWZ1_CERPU|nr:hypothetical protein KC19_8G030100 [Ceratodon purpureus]